MILEVRIPKELRADFLEVRILKGLRFDGVYASWRQRANDGPGVFELSIVTTRSTITYELLLVKDA
jgi:hypothetical protein